jgi:hypothetical protein
MPVSVRAATMDDLPFIDALQKKHTKQVGFMPTKQLEGKIKAGHVLVAWASRPCSEDTGKMPVLQEERVGYLIGNDQYFKRDDVGIIYQINIAQGKRRALVGASLLKAQFERSAYGCRLYCCWCAQDIEANRFWESMGFVPLAFRAGSATKSRIHIFWQKRIRSGDEGTPWWFPAQTNSGSIREDRLVLPIPPGTHWSDAKPIILPETTHAHSDEPKRLPLKRPMHGRDAARLSSPKSHATKKITPPRPTTLQERGGLRFGNPAPPPPEKKPREKRAKIKNDPKYVAAARELRDRWLEKVNAPGGASLLLPSGKYDVSRTLSAVEGSRALVEPGHRTQTIPTLPIPALPAA